MAARGPAATPVSDAALARRAVRSSRTRSLRRDRPVATFRHEGERGGALRAHAEALPPFIVRRSRCKNGSSWWPRAALALGSRGYAGDEPKTSTTTSGQASGTTASQQSGSAGEAQQAGTGTQRDSPAAEKDPALHPTEAERQAGGSIGRQPGETKSIVGTVEKVEKAS